MFYKSKHVKTSFKKSLHKSTNNSTADNNFHILSVSVLIEIKMMDK